MPYLSDRQYGLLPHQRLLIKLKNSSSITRRLKLDRTLNVHKGCVNTICWNERGSMILSGSDDQHLIVTDPFTTKILTSVHSGHRENIFSAKFLPETNDRRVVSCSGDGVIFQTDFDRPNHTHSTEGCFTCHGSTTAYEVRVIPHTPNLFLSCSDDCTVRLYDLRTKSTCLKPHCMDDILIRSKWGITSIDINPLNPNEIICACSDSSVRLYDHRKLSTRITSEDSTPRRCEASISGLISRFVLTDRKEPRPPRITSVVFNQHGTEVLASYSSESLYLLDPKQSLSHDLLNERLSEHRSQKRSRNGTNGGKPTTSNKHSNDSSAKPDNSTTTAENQKASQFKRLRLRGDWSDTGPESRPSGDDETDALAAQAAAPEQTQDNVEEPSSSTNTDESQTTARSRNLQNFFMQRMSDILTQLVTRTAAPTEPTELGEEGETTERTTTDANQPESDPTLTTPPEINHPASSADENPTTINNPIVEQPPSPILPNDSAPPINDDNHIDDDEDDNEDEDSHDPRGIFEIIFGGQRRARPAEADDDEDDNSIDEDEDDDEDSPSSPTTTNDASTTNTTSDRSTARARRPLMAAKLDRIIKRRDAERRHEEDLLKDLPSLGLINSYDGHRNARTMIKEANFWSDSYVMSGSDCGHIFIWNKITGNIVRIIRADEHVVNCLQPHPLDYPILASSGIDYNIKLFSPLAQSPVDDSELITRTVKRNHAMIEETSSTITVPAAFMFRMLTSFYRLPRASDFAGMGDDESTE